MSDRFNKISEKVEDIAAKKRKELDERNAKVKVVGRSILGIKGKVKSQKVKPASKVARGMQSLVMIISAAIALIVINVNIWPFNLFNDAGLDVSWKMKLLSFIVFALPLYLIGVIITKPMISRLEKKYGKQAW